MNKKKYNIKESPTFRLFSLPDFWSGFGSVLDLRGNETPYNYDESDQEADYRAILSDWDAIRGDFISGTDKAIKHQKG